MPESPPTITINLRFCYRAGNAYMARANTTQNSVEQTQRPTSRQLHIVWHPLKQRRSRSVGIGNSTVFVFDLDIILPYFRRSSLTCRLQEVSLSHWIAAALRQHCFMQRQRGIFPFTIADHVRIRRCRKRIFMDEWFASTSVVPHS